ncbi:hypothetical protein [Endozoicomonas sp.]|uniref:hypothetical protein n=1 Tax=Endozoicomonas sp. TaxID=1892382 RepID=UPI002888227B|nr:hypothetical protein [Endozoicomonas sp.]
MTTQLIDNLARLEEHISISRNHNITMAQLIILLILKDFPMNLAELCERPGFGPNKVRELLRMLLLPSGKNKKAIGFIHKPAAQELYVLTEPGRGWISEL